MRGATLIRGDQEAMSMLAKRDLIGFAVAPLPFLGPLLLMHCVILLDWPTDSRFILRSMLGLVLWSYAATLLIGLPIHLFLRWKGRRDLIAYLGATVVASILTGCISALMEGIFWPSRANNPFGFTMWSRFGLTAMLAFTAVASACAWVFWRFAVRQARL